MKDRVTIWIIVRRFKTSYGMIQKIVWDDLKIVWRFATSYGTILNSVCDDLKRLYCGFKIQKTIQQIIQHVCWWWCDDFRSHHHRMSIRFDESHMHHRSCTDAAMLLCDKDGLHHQVHIQHLSHYTAILSQCWQGPTHSSTCEDMCKLHQPNVKHTIDTRGHGEADWGWGGPTSFTKRHDEVFFFLGFWQVIPTSDAMSSASLVTHNGKNDARRQW